MPRGELRPTRAVRCRRHQPRAVGDVEPDPLGHCSRAGGKASRARGVVAERGQNRVDPAAFRSRQKWTRSAIEGKAACSRSAWPGGRRHPLSFDRQSPVEPKSPDHDGGPAPRPPGR